MLEQAFISYLITGIHRHQIALFAVSQVAGKEAKQL